MVGAILVALAAAVAAASPPVEIETEATGTAEVPAQGYLVTAFFTSATMPGIPASKPPATPAARKAARKAADAIGTVPGETCGGEADKFGFIGNEQAGGPTPEDDPDLATAFESYRAIFTARARAERAAAILKDAGANVVTDPAPVLFQCDAARLKAKQAALIVARGNAEQYATMLGVHVGEVLRVSDRPSGDWTQMMRAVSDTRAHSQAGDTVRVTATLTVTYRAGR